MISFPNKRCEKYKGSKEIESVRVGDILVFKNSNSLEKTIFRIHLQIFLILERKGCLRVITAYFIND